VLRGWLHLLPENPQLGSLLEDVHAGRRAAKRSRPLDLRSARRAAATNIRALDVRPDSGNAVASHALDVGSDGTTDAVRPRTGGGNVHGLLGPQLPG